jgi:hypothetical protein
LVLPDLKAHKGRKAPLVRRAPLVSVAKQGLPGNAAKLARLDLPGQRVIRVQPLRSGLLPG